MPRSFGLVLLLLLSLTACQGQTPGGAARPPAPGWDIGPLPGTARHASDTSPVDGATVDAVGDGTSASGPALIIDGTAIDYSWARYAFAVPGGMRLNSISLDTVVEAPYEYWVGLSDYGRGVWEWHGPYTAGQSLPLGMESAKYISPAGTFYWAVVAARDNKLTLNSTTVDYSSVSLGMPPSGQATVMAGGSLTPALVIMPKVIPNIGAGSPLIAYIHVEGSSQKLYFAYYDGGAWVQQAILAEHDFSLPRMRWLGTEGIITAYDQTAGALVDIRFNQALAVSRVTTIMANPGLGFANQSLDVSSTGELGLAHGYADSTTGKLFYSWNDGTGWQTMAALHDADPVAGICFRFDPQDGADPWLFYTHGTIDNSTSIMISFKMEEARLHGGNWTITQFDYADSPLAVDLHFKPDNSPQICFLASRVFTYSIPFGGGNFSGSLLYDVVVSTKTGDTWQTGAVFTSSLIPHVTFPPLALTVNVDDGAEVDWAKDNELIYASFTGSVDIDLVTQQPTGGTLAPGAQYMVDGGSGFADSPYFTGAAGTSFSWGDLFSNPATAYIKSDTVDPAALMGGTVNAANDLIYWNYRTLPPPPG